MRNYYALTYEQLSLVTQKNIAIIVACWNESDVIGKMLEYNADIIDYENYIIFVGTYPNDPQTINAVKNIEKLTNKVKCIVGSNPGPTTKADNLNAIYNWILYYEQEQNIKFDMIVFHDSEDIIHSLSLKLYNYLIPEKDMVQLPVLPLEVNFFNFTHWIYNDEFAESHTKDIVVREGINGLVPSAGVGTAFSRKAIKMLVDLSPNKNPFPSGRLTEDYNTSLKINIAGLKSVFFTQAIYRTIYKKKWWSYHHRPTIIREYVATRSLFPTEYIKAVRQKARWIMGISMQEWVETGWVGNFQTRYTLFHDRKSIISHLINGAGYLVLLFWLNYGIWCHYYPEYPTLQELLNQTLWVWYLIVFCTFVMVERMLQRLIATYRIYGMWPALLSVLRIPYANLLNLHALLRAYKLFIFNVKSKAKLKWEKTEHVFNVADDSFKSYKKLGKILIEKKIISKNKLISLIDQQYKTGVRLEELLLKYNILTKNQFYKILSEQYQIDFIVFKNKVLDYNFIKKISKKNYNWLIKNDVVPLYLEKDKILFLGIYDVGNMNFTEIIKKKIFPYEAKFKLIMYK